MVWQHEDRQAAIQARAAGGKNAATEAIISPIIERAKQEAIASGRGWTVEQEIMLRQQLMPQVAAAQVRAAQSGENADKRARTAMIIAEMQKAGKDADRELKWEDFKSTDAARRALESHRSRTGDQKDAELELRREFEGAKLEHKKAQDQRVFELAEQREQRLTLSAEQRREKEAEELRLKAQGLTIAESRALTNAKWLERLGDQKDRDYEKEIRRLEGDEKFRETREKFMKLGYERQVASDAALQAHRSNMLEASVGKANAKKIEHVREADVSIAAIDDLTKYIEAAPKTVAGGFGYGNVILERVKDFIYDDPDAAVWANEVEQKMNLLKFNALAFLKGYKPNRYDQGVLESLIPGVDPKRGTAITLSGLKNLRGEIERQKNSVMGELRTGLREKVGAGGTELGDDEYMDIITGKK
jgi:hypothetical protein